MIAFLLEHASWLTFLVPGVGPILGLFAGGLPKAWKIGMILAALVAVGGTVLWIGWDLADKRATIAEQQTSIVTLAAQRDQEAATARRNADALAALRKVAEAEQAARERQRRAYEAAITQRDKILDEVRREKTARDPLPGAFRPLLGLR